MTNKPKLPAEWEQHAWVWIGFPHDGEEWPEALQNARHDVANFANAVQCSGEQVRLIVRDQENADLASSLVNGEVAINIHKFGDIWLRDTGPLVIKRDDRKSAKLFDFNGWGDKFVMDGDREIGADLAQHASLQIEHAPLVLEGGSLDVDGSGLAVTTEQCLLNPNRNSNASPERIEKLLNEHLGIERMLWLGDGLINDHTDGHIDNLARFVGPGTIAIPVAEGTDDPNAAIYADAHNRAEQYGLNIVAMPSPGRITVDGAVIPASYMNFYIANDAVIVPVYDRPNDVRAVEAIGSLFPDRQAIGVPALGIISGGGSFHCCSQQMPL